MRFEKGRVSKSQGFKEEQNPEKEIMSQY